MSSITLVTEQERAQKLEFSLPVENFFWSQHYGLKYEREVHA